MVKQELGIRTPPILSLAQQALYLPSHLHSPRFSFYFEIGFRGAWGSLVFLILLILYLPSPGPASMCYHDPAAAFEIFKQDLASCVALAGLRVSIFLSQLPS